VIFSDLKDLKNFYFSYLPPIYLTTKTLTPLAILYSSFRILFDIFHFVFSLGLTFIFIFNIYHRDNFWTRSNIIRIRFTALGSIYLSNMLSNTCTLVGKCAFYASICPNAIYWPISSCATCPGSDRSPRLIINLCGMCCVLRSLPFISTLLGSTTS